MSRTYRRTKGYIPYYVLSAALPLPPHRVRGLDPDSYKTAKYTWYRRMDYRDGEWFNYNHKALQQNNAFWFGDHGYAWRRLYGKDTRKMAREWTQVKHRAQARTELIKYNKNPEYEVIIPRKELLPWD